MAAQLRHHDATDVVAHSAGHEQRRAASEGLGITALMPHDQQSIACKQRAGGRWARVSQAQSKWRCLSVIGGVSKSANLQRLYEQYQMRLRKVKKCGTVNMDR